VGAPAPRRPGEGDQAMVLEQALYVGHLVFACLARTGCSGAGGG
jgi:hypothetical protein